jgi:hypothetical protein
VNFVPGVLLKLLLLHSNFQVALVIAISPIQRVTPAFDSSLFPELDPALLCTAACNRQLLEIIFSQQPHPFLRPDSWGKTRAMSSGMANEIKLLSGSSHTELSNKVANRSVLSLVRKWLRRAPS